jgi:threonine synthase
MLGFESLLTAKLITNCPRYIGVQPENCAPLARTFKNGSKVLENVEVKPTIAEGTSVKNPSRANAILKRLYSGQGIMVQGSEQQILETYQSLACLGVYCEPTSALSLIPLLDDKIELTGPIVAVMTGSGLKANLTT